MRMVVGIDEARDDELTGRVDDFVDLASAEPGRRMPVQDPTGHPGPESDDQAIDNQNVFDRR